jgi:chlorite dismutase
MTAHKEFRRQFVSFGFLKLNPEWRRLSAAEKAEHRGEFLETVQHWAQPDTMKVLSYSTIGMRADCDMLLWRICYSLDCLQEMSASLRRTQLGSYLAAAHSYLGMTRRSIYEMGENERHAHLAGGVVKPGEHKYLFVYPLVRTRNWYQLPFEERQRMIHELTKIHEEFARIQVNIIYSFGLDSQDYIIANETNHPEECLERYMRLREASAGAFVQSDTPIFSCVQDSLQNVLEKLG